MTRNGDVLSAEEERDLPDFSGGWNYRVVRHADEDKTTDEWYHIHEVYYNGQGVIIGWTDEHTPLGNDPDDLRGEMELMLEAFDRPVLNASDLPTSDGAP